MTFRSTGARRRSVVLVTMVAVAALLAACSSDSKTSAGSTSSGSSSSSDVPATSPPPTGTPLKLAILVDATGPQSSGQGVSVDVAKAWIAYANSHGGVAGHPVSLDVKDTKGDAPTGQSAATAAAADTATIGTLLVDSAGESSYGKTISDGGLPVIGGLGYFPTVWGALPNVFGITTQFPAVVDEQVVAAQKVGSKGTGVAACAEVDSCAAAAPIFENASKTAGIPYNGLVKIANSATSFTAECLQFINSGTDYIQLSAGGAVSQRMYTDCVQQGFAGYMGASAGTVGPDLYKGSDIKLTGGLNGFPWWVDDAPVKQFRAVMDAEKVSADTYGSPVATATYTTLELFKKALEADAALPASPTRADLVAAYGKVSNETLDGLLPQPLTFTANAPGPKVTCFWLYTYENQKFAGTLTPTCDTLAG